MTVIEEFVVKLNSAILNPIITLLFVLAFLYFIWGVFKFISNAENPDERKIGSQHMMWGVIGMFIMFAVGGLLALIKSSLGL